MALVVARARSIPNLGFRGRKPGPSSARASARVTNLQPGRKPPPWSLKSHRKEHLHTPRGGQRQKQLRNPPIQKRLQTTQARMAATELSPACAYCWSRRAKTKRAWPADIATYCLPSTS
jgi:hypothetical protein